jgi:hypothetical protein
MTQTMDKLQLTGQILGQVFNFICDRAHAGHLLFYGIKLPNLKMKTLPKLLLGYLPLYIVLPAQTLFYYRSGGLTSDPIHLPCL